MGMRTTFGPYKKMTRSIPAGSGSLNGLADLLPGMKASSFERQRTQHLPPGFNQVEIGGVPGLKDEYPAGMAQTEEQHVRCAVSTEVIDNGIHAFHFRWYSSIDLGQAIHSVDGRASGIGPSESSANQRAERTEDVACAPLPHVVCLLPGALIPTKHVLARITLSTLWVHLVQTYDATGLGWVRIQLLSPPLFRAKSAATRLPHQASWVRHRKPSSRDTSSIRLRFIPMPLNSLRYVSRRSRVQLAKGKPSVWGFVNDSALTLLPSSDADVGGRPAACSSFSPLTPVSLKRLIDGRSVSLLRPTTRTMSGNLSPWRERQMTWARSTSRAGTVLDRANRSMVSCSALVYSRTRNSRGMAFSRFLPPNLWLIYRMHH